MTIKNKKQFNILWRMSLAMRIKNRIAELRKTFDIPTIAYMVSQEFEAQGVFIIKGNDVFVYLD